MIKIETYSIFQGFDDVSVSEGLAVSGTFSVDDV